MADTKKATKAQETPVQEQPKTDDQMKADILTGILDKDARTYTMQKTVSINGEEKEGAFVFRYPTVADRLRQGLIQTKYLNGTPVESLDIMTYNIAYSMAFLASVTVTKPAWFAYENMDSLEELNDMFREVNAFVDSFRKSA